MNDKNKIQTYLLIGLIAALVTVVLGELPIGWYITPNNNDMLQAQLDGYATLSMAQLAFGVFFGSIGIAFQSFGYKAISIVIRNEAKDKRASNIVNLGVMFCAMFGPIIHILAIMIMYLSRFLDVDTILDFALYFIIPITIVFMSVYLTMMIFIFFVIIKDETSLPRWFAFANPFIIMLLVDAITSFIGNYYISNSIHMADMGLASLITFIFWFVGYKGKENDENNENNANNKKKKEKKTFTPFKSLNEPYRLRDRR